MPPVAHNVPSIAHNVPPIPQSHLPTNHTFQILLEKFKSQVIKAEVKKAWFTAMDTTQSTAMDTTQSTAMDTTQSTAMDTTQSTANTTKSKQPTTSRPQYVHRTYLLLTIYDFINVVRHPCPW